MPLLRRIQQFLHLEAAPGLLLMGATAVALVFANSPLRPLHEHLLQAPMVVQVGTFKIAKPLLLWVNDELMAAFFLLVGLELKREVLDGQLSKPAQVVLPLIGAVAGMATPALIYTFFNHGHPIAMRGWAVPAATDIAFALGVLSLLGDRVPSSLRLFLLALAIFDDVGAIVIIAIFYTEDLSLVALGLALIGVTLLVFLNRARVTSRAPYIIAGIVLWVCVLKSGVHATLAGVVVGLAIPLRGRTADSPSPLLSLEHGLHPWVVFGILPFFAFCNAGVPVGGLGWDVLSHPVMLGIALGLLVGNPLGITTICYLVIRTGLAQLPTGATWRQLYGTAALCGVGFTMSLFISALAFEKAGGEFFAVDRLGVLAGSGLAALHGVLVLLPRVRNAPNTD